ncbi:protein-export chaperone SecB [Methylococcus geothermalis]|uniref:Protein-export protein SecB n=1 Tax=Methylococcus geothermalis TaxID=2681310 RepID=A0A858QBT8_9GAMM|nr:protein-export chaperone SecB [Methylococcus geothermalis]QJD31241.1 protein-export chaperone SecB [Methylococcus geothermalis]
MSEENQQPERQFAIQKLYIKDVSFETPNSPGIFTLTWEPKVEFNLGSKVQTLQEGLFEVSLTVTITVKLEDKTAYLVEICQAGIFTISHFPEQEMGPLLGSYCPNILFPYAREAVSDLVSKGGFPPMLLAPINFDALYMQQIQMAQQQAQQATPH